MTVWLQERPSWCPHGDCKFLGRLQDANCVGALPVPEPHDGDMNTHRICFGPQAETKTVDFQMNANDADGMRWLMDKIDGKKTSWRSRLGPTSK